MIDLSAPNNTPLPPSLDDLREQLEAAHNAYPALRQGIGAALTAIRRAQGESIPTREDRRAALRCPDAHAIL